MGRLIDADALYAKVQEGEELARKRVLDTESTLPCPTNINPAYTRYFAQMDERTKLKHMIADAPTVHPKPPKIGKWTSENACSECGCQPWFERNIWSLHYCPNCGAKMEG